MRRLAAIGIAAFGLTLVALWVWRTSPPPAPASPAVASGPPGVRPATAPPAAADAPRIAASRRAGDRAPAREPAGVGSVRPGARSRASGIPMRVRLPEDRFDAPPPDAGTGRPPAVRPPTGIPPVGPRVAQSPRPAPEPPPSPPDAAATTLEPAPTAPGPDAAVEDAVLDCLARKSLGEGASEAEVSRRAGIGKTLLSGLPDERDEIVQRGLDELENCGS